MIKGVFLLAKGFILPKSIILLKELLVVWMSDSGKIFSESFLTSFLFALVFFANPGFVYASEKNLAPLSEAGQWVSDSEFVFDLTDSYDSLNLADSVGSNEINSNNKDALESLPPAPVLYGQCSVSSLSGIEAKNILNATHEGFDGKSISTGFDSNDDSKITDLGGVSLIGQQLGGNKAVKVEAPSLAVPSDRFSFFNGTRVDGPFGVGLIMDDTIRIGRCNYPTNQQDLCKINGDGLSVRTSGVGFVSDFKNAFKSATSGVQSLAEASLSSTDLNKLKSNYLPIDSNDFITGSFANGDFIKNSVLADRYTAKNSTNCNNSSCMISIYSAFDKYFNSFFTIDLVVTNLGPMFVHKGFKLFTKGAKSFGDGSIPNSYGWHIPQRLRQLVTPSALVAKKRYSRYTNLVKEEKFSDLLDPLTIDAKLFSPGAGGHIAKITGPDSRIWKMAPEERKKFFEAIENLRYYAITNADEISLAEMEFNNAIKAAGLISDPVARANAEKVAKMKFAQDVSRLINQWDNAVFLNSPGWIMANPGLLTLDGFALKRNGPAGAWPGQQGFVDIKESGALSDMLYEFSENGNWINWSNNTSTNTFESLADGSLKLYKLDTSYAIMSNPSLSDLSYYLSKQGPGAYTVKLPDGSTKSLTSETIEYIKSNENLSGGISLFETKYVEANPLTPEDFANRLTNRGIIKRPMTAVRNMDDLHNILVQNDFAPRSYWSVLDEQFAKEGDMIKSYFKDPMVGIYKGTILPIAYWNAKQGFGNFTGYEGISAFLLPDTWSELVITQGVQKIYDASFIDFFANEGSDQGDMFRRVFSSLPWAKGLELAMEKNNWIKENISKISGGFFSGSTTRDTVNDLAFYFHNESCSNCTAQMTSNSEYLSVDFTTGTNTQAFLIEANTPQEKEKTGSMIISYTHHSDLSGKTKKGVIEKINLVNARQEEVTCDQKLREWGLGWAGPASGGLLAAAENVFYFAGFGPGLLASVYQQLLIGRELQDCVDDVEGYYSHFYTPPEKDNSKSKSKEVISNEKITDALSGMSEKLHSTISNDSKQGAPSNPIEKSLDNLKNQFLEFAKNAKRNNILQATVEFAPPSQGQVNGKEVFYIWYKGNSMPSEYKTSGKIITTDLNKKVEFDFERGELKINDKIAIGPNKADHVRVAITPIDTRIPAQVVPMTINKTGAPMTNDTVFELNSYGEVKVLDYEILGCIQKAVYDQSGINYSGNELTQVFGKLSGIRTTKYGSVFARQQKIFLEGNGPRIQGDAKSKFLIDGYWNSKLFIDNNQSVDSGKFISMVFEYGTIILKPETNEIIIWLRQHKDAVLSSADVKGLNTKLSSIKDPETDCEVPAIELEAVPNLNDDLGALKVNNFNTSMKHLGPFTQLVTDKRIYEFYSKRDPATGDCRNYFRIIDKATGKIITDAEIVGGIKQNSDGSLSFKTADGKNHTINFDAENGVPKVFYNGGPPETLLSAQGPKGSFWYDPQTGLWHPENGLQIPMNPAFKDKGVWFEGDRDGNVKGTPENKMTFNIGSQGQQGFNLPSMPENITGIIAFVALFLITSFITTRGRIKTNKRK